MFFRNWSIGGGSVAQQGCEPGANFVINQWVGSREKRLLSWWYTTWCKCLLGRVECRLWYVQLNKPLFAGPCSPIWCCCHIRQWCSLSGGSRWLLFFSVSSQSPLQLLGLADIQKEVAVLTPESQALYFLHGGLCIVIKLDHGVWVESGYTVVYTRSTAGGSKCSPAELQY